MEESDWLKTRRDAAQFLAVCEKTLANLSQPHGPIPVVRIGRAVRYDTADLREFITAQKTNSMAGDEQ